MGEAARLKRVVLDTNVVVSALLFPGRCGRLVPLWQGGAFTFLASAAIVREYARVLAYPKFRLAAAEVAGLLHEEVIPYLESVAVESVARVVTEDPADDEFLACAVSGRAGTIVSGDRHLLRFKRYRRVEILTVDAFLAGFETRH